MGFVVDLDPAKRGTLRNLNEISPEVLAELRRASSQLEAERKLRHYADSESQPYVLAYVLDVVLGGQDPHRWRRGGVLVPTWGLADLLTRSPDSLVDPVGLTACEVTVRIPPERTAWDDGSHSVGSPAAVRDDIDYRWSGGGRCSRSPADRVVQPVTDPIVCIRRWIASRAAMVLHSVGIVDSAIDVNAVARVAGVDVDALTPDARAAVEGLLAERRFWSDSESCVPGFTGPDRIYVAGSRSD